MIQLASPWFLLLLLLLPLVATLPWWGGRRQRPVGVRYAGVQRVGAIPSWRLWSRPILPTMRWLALALLIVALARPQRVDAQRVIRGQGVDIALALDISGSMAALDFQPQNRLTAAKLVIEAFVQERAFDRIGLVVFAGEAFAKAPHH